MRKHMRTLAIVMLVCLALSAMPARALYNDEMFTDVPGSAWYCEAAYYVNDHGLMQGTSHFNFSPNLTTTRAMIVTILHRLEGEPAASGSPFRDVAASAWYGKAVAWASANGIVNGMTKTTFAPNEAITREQMAAILYRYAAWRGIDVSKKADLSRFADAGQISAWARDAMAWANAQGLINGTAPTTLSPKGSATRAQVATIFMRLNEQFIDPPHPDDPNAKWFLMSIDEEVNGKHSLTVLWHTQEGHLTTMRTPDEGTVVEIHRNFSTDAPVAETEQTYVNGQLVSTMEYDKDGNVLTDYDNTTDEQMTYTYNENGIPTRGIFYSPKSGFQSGIVFWLRYAYTPDGKVQSITRWDNVSDTYVFLPDQLVSDADAVFHSGEYHHYDAAGNLVRVTAANAAGLPIDEGWEYTYQYDAEGRVSRETYSDSEGSVVTTYAYDAWDHIVKETVTEDGVTTTYTYNWRAFVF